MALVAGLEDHVVAEGRAALGLVGPIPARVSGRVKLELLGLIDHATGEGWTQARACRVLRLDDRRARRWQERRREGLALDDEPGGGHPVHGLMPVEIEAILELHSKWGEIDRSHRKLAHRGSYQQLGWISPGDRLTGLARYGRVLRYRPAPSASVKKPWPDWVEYRPNQVWGYDFSTFTAAGVEVSALLDLVSRKWIEKLICTVEATSVQVQVVFTRALEAEGLLDQALADPALGDRTAADPAGGV